MVNNTNYIFDLMEKIEKKQLTQEQKNEFKRIEKDFWDRKDTGKSTVYTVNALSKLLDEINEQY